MGPHPQAGCARGELKSILSHFFLPPGGELGHQSRPQPPWEHPVIPTLSEKGQVGCFRKNWKIPYSGTRLNSLTSEDVSRRVASPAGNPTVPNACIILLFIIFGPRKTISQTGYSLKIRGTANRLEAQSILVRAKIARGLGSVGVRTLGRVSP